MGPYYVALKEPGEPRRHFAPPPPPSLSALPAAHSLPSCSMSRVCSPWCACSYMRALASRHCCRSSRCFAGGLFGCLSVHLAQICLPDLPFPGRTRQPPPPSFPLAATHAFLII